MPGSGLKAPGRANQTLGLSLPLFLVFTLLATSIASAQTGAVYTGSVTVQSVRAEGLAKVTLGASRALLLDDGGENVSASMRLSAAQLTVNWTHVVRQGFGQSESDPEGSLYSHSFEPRHGEKRFSDVEGVHSVDHALANQLILLEEATVDFQSSGKCFGSEVEAETWRGGMTSNRSTSAGPTPLETEFPILPGSVIARCTGGRIEIAGNFQVYLWRGDLRVAETEDVFRSGVWYENATAPNSIAPRGITREEHAQLLRLDVNGGTMRIEQDSGLLQANAQSMDLEVQGKVHLAKASGLIQSAANSYRLEDSDATFSGDTLLPLKPGDDTLIIDGLRSSAKEFTSSPESTTVGPAIGSGQARPISGSFKAAAPNQATPLWLLASLFMLSAAAVGAFRFWPVHAHPDALLAFAADALEDRRPTEARAAAGKALRRNRKDPRALLLIAASYMQEGNPEAAVGALEPSFQVQTGQDRATFAYVLAVASARIGDSVAKNHWIEEAERDKEVRRRVRSDRTLGPSPMADGTVSQVDVAYV